MSNLLPSTLFGLSETINGVLDFFGVDPETARLSALRLLVIWGLVFFGSRLLKLVAVRIVVAADDGDDGLLSYGEKRAQTIAGLLRGVGSVVLLAFGLILTLGTFMDIGPLLAGAGVVGLAISFGAQSLVKDMISGFFILMESQFDVGDTIEVAGLSGSVEKMTIRVVMIRDVNGVLHIIPNGQIATVSNKTRGWSRSVLDIGVDYGADVDQAIAVLKDEAVRFGKDGDWVSRLDGTPEVLGVQALGDNAVTIRVVIRTIPGSQWEVGREFLRRTKNRLDREGIEIPFPQRTVHVRHHGPGADSIIAGGA
jgi:small conductance mechanosensitive channel